jgi:lipopolysaccharide/colanic/teichoic acid biosynthesis glycosyltransferase
MTAGDRGSARRFVKRLFDLAIAAAALVLLSPILLVAAIAIILVDGRPILFRQLRPGREGRPFRLCKFRTMSSDGVADSEPQPDAERLTRLGRNLRITSLDELPTLWNVLVGEMSLVGPRPLLMEYLPLYSPEQSRRHAMRPGITGWAQVNGRNAISWEQKFAYDVWYVDHWTLGLDLQILARTFVNVLRAEGINQSGQATMEKFRGSAR